MSGALTADLVVGKVYDVDHDRKGSFRLKITEIDEIWITGRVISGRATYNTGADAVAGDEITVSTKLASFTPVRAKKGIKK